MPNATLAAGAEHVLERIGDSLSTTAREAAEDLGHAVAERTSLLDTSHEELAAQVEGSLRGLGSPDPGGPPTYLDYGDELRLDPIALEHVLMASDKLRTEAAEHADRLGRGLLPGPGPTIHSAIGHANAAIPRALGTHLEQWQRMCSDISSFKDANTSADSLAARCLAPAGGGELR